MEGLLSRILSAIYELRLVLCYGCMSFFSLFLPCINTARSIILCDLESQREYLTYWTCYACTEAIETFIATFHGTSRYPPELKVLWILWLTSPSTQGAFQIYNLLIRPLFKNFESEIDSAIDDMGNKLSDKISHIFKVIVYQLAFGPQDGLFTSGIKIAHNAYTTVRGRMSDMSNGYSSRKSNGIGGIGRASEISIGGGRLSQSSDVSELSGVSSIYSNSGNISTASLIEPDSAFLSLLRAGVVVFAQVGVSDGGDNASRPVVLRVNSNLIKDSYAREDLPDSIQFQGIDRSNSGNNSNNRNHGRSSRSRNNSPTPPTPPTATNTSKSFDQDETPSRGPFGSHRKTRDSTNNSTGLRRRSRSRSSNRSPTKKTNTTMTTTTTSNNSSINNGLDAALPSELSIRDQLVRVYIDTVRNPCTLKIDFIMDGSSHSDYDDGVGVGLGVGVGGVVTVKLTATDERAAECLRLGLKHLIECHSKSKH